MLGLRRAKIVKVITFQRKRERCGEKASTQYKNQDGDTYGHVVRDSDTALRPKDIHLFWVLHSASAAVCPSSPIRRRDH